MTNNTPFNFIGLAAVALLAIVGTTQNAKAADNLEAALKAAGWEKIVGTWSGPGGAESTFKWKDTDTLESITTMGEVKRTSIIKHAAGKITITSSDNKGGSSSGECSFADSKAVFKITSVSTDGKKKDLVVNYHLADANTLKVQMEGSEKGATFTRK